MQLFIFIFYLLLSILFFRYYKFDQNTGLSFAVIVGLFLLRVLAGTLNLYIHFYSVVSNDVGFYHWQSVNELKAMHENPQQFFYEWLLNWGDFRLAFDFSSPLCNMFWKDLGILAHTKYMTFANILSLGNQYVNVVIFNIPYFIGQLYLYKSFYQKQPEKKGLFVFVIFLIPSVLFWCSGIHKDVWVLASFGIIIYSLNNYLVHRNSKYFFTLIAALFYLFIVRYFYLLALLPLLFLWMYTEKRKQKLVYYLSAFLVTLLLFFNIQKVLPSVNPMKMIQSRQTEFLGHIGYSDMKTPPLENHFWSYLENLPVAVNHVLLQPTYSGKSPMKYKISALDNYWVLLIILILLLYFKRKNCNEAMFLSLIFYAVSIYLFIGYTIPNCGALVRYKSEFTVLLLASLVGLSEIPALNHFLNRMLSRFE